MHSDYTVARALLHPFRRLLWPVAVLGLATGCGGGGVAGPDPAPPPPADPELFTWSLPSNFPLPNVPADNPMTVSKVLLGRHLFYDRRLSTNGEASCASCHRQSLAFTDGRARAVGATGDVHPRSAMSLVNLAYSPNFNWGDPLTRSLEAQALVPVFNDHPLELGLAGQEARIVALFRSDSTYAALFPRAFPGQPDPFTVGNWMKALAAFQRSLVSAQSPYDRYVRGDRDAISQEAKVGEALFFSERLECFHCHGGFTFTGTSDHVGKPFPEREFFNTGLYNVDGNGAYPSDNRGIYEFTQRPEDMGKFKSPTLRNVAVTAPYFHDGSAATLDDVIDHYARGGRLIASGPNAGDGRSSPLKNGFIQGFTLTSAERAGLLAFLRSLTDSTFLTTPLHANPWPAGHPARGPS
jgi:cytochrome c peroxidase